MGLSEVALKINQTAIRKHLRHLLSECAIYASLSMQQFIIWYVYLLLEKNTMSEDKIVDEDDIDVIEIYDDDGGVVKFELLDTIEFKGSKYMVIAPLNEDEEVDEEIEHVYITLVSPAADGQEVLEMIEDDKIIEQVFEEFKKRNKTNFEFV